MLSSDILTSVVVAFVVTLIITIGIGKVSIPLLKKLHAQQSIREEGPKSHQSKAGTPTMGGLFMMLSLTISVLIFSPWTATTAILLLLILGHCALGFFDDFVKSVKKRNLGLTAKQKLLGQIILAGIFCYVVTQYIVLPTTLWIPLANVTINIGFLYYVLAFVVIVGTSNAVNLTDGLDGLAAGTAAITAIAYAVIGLLYDKIEISYLGAIICAVCLGFLVFNSNPAKVFMGDTGSLALGAAFAGMAIMTKTELLLIILGGVFVAEALSVIIQVISFKTRGVRVFKMSPIHHHFELSGWTEQKVVNRFWIAGGILALISLCIYFIK